MFISLEGIDGSGKTTLVSEVSKRLKITPVVKKHVSSDDVFVNEQIKKIASANYPGYNAIYDPNLSYTYWTYLQCVWYTLIYDYSINPMLKNNQSCVTDGWYYKFFSKKMTDGHLSLDILERMFVQVKEPSLVILLDVNPETVIARQKHFNSAEAGGHMGKELSEESFFDYQTQMRENLLELADRHNWVKIQIEKDEALETTAARIVEEILKRKS